MSNHPIPGQEYSTDELRQMALERRRELYDQWTERTYYAKALLAVAPMDYVLAEDWIHDVIEHWVSEEDGSIPGFTGTARNLAFKLGPVVSRIAALLGGLRQSLHDLEAVGGNLAESVGNVSDVLEPALPVHMSYERAKLERHRTDVRTQIQAAYFDLREAIAGAPVPSEPLNQFRERVEEIAESAIRGTTNPERERQAFSDVMQHIADRADQAE